MSIQLPLDKVMPASSTVRPARLLAVFICVICLILTTTGVGLEILSRATGRGGIGIYPGGLAIALLFPAVGSLIIWWRPGNPIGWIFCGMGLSECLTALTQPYAYYALIAHPGALPAADLASWVDVWIWIPGFTLIAYLLLLFPTGTLLSSRWRSIGWLAAANMILAVIVPAATSWSRRGLYLVTHPDGVAPTGAFVLLSDLSSVLLFGTLAASIVSLVLRLWRSQGIERQQLKWFTYAAALAALALAATILLNPNGGYLNGDLLNDGASLLQFFGFAAIPTSVGVAILRYQLFDIDILINRTLVYGSLSAVLAATYFGCVIAAQAIIQAVTGSTNAPPALIVASTLLVVALFNPLRHRIQATIDRSFYRRKYDAQKMLTSFAATLRTETDLTHLTRHLVGVVDETMQPERVSLWLRPADREVRI